MSNIPYSEISSIGLYPSGNKDIKVDSHVIILYQDSMRGNVPYPGGIYDDHMGSTAHEWTCGTCKHDKRLCPGHFGLIPLKYPVLSPMFIKEILKWLKIICFNCGKIIYEFKKTNVRKDKILTEFIKSNARTQEKNVKCIHCSELHPHIMKDKSDSVSIYMEFYETNSSSPNKGQLIAHAPLYPHQIRNIFKRIDDSTVLDMGKPLIAHPKKFILNVLRGPPNPIRPDVKKIGGGRSNNNDLTVLLQTIVKINNDIPNTIPDVITQELGIMIHNLCLATFDLIKGSNNANKRTIVNNSKKPLTSIAKRWPRKLGRVRRNLMGRRASHMGRSFITCDPFLKIDEVGVPISIARNIQFPEVVQEYNYNKMLIYFMNGTKRYPGCTKIKKSNGGTYSIDKVEKLEVGDIIYRDIVEGDIVGFGRQPSLEPSSISSMKVVIMTKGDTIRMNVLSCPFFNADFDGDAMILLFVRSNRTANEIRELSSPSQFFISYKDGAPKVGEAQDSLIGTAELTRSDVRIDKYHAMQMFAQIKVYHDFSQYSNEKIFTGRDLISILLKETNNLINYTGVASIYKESQVAYRKYDQNDIKVEIDRGTLKSGILDKASIGENSQGGIFHIIHNQYGPAAALEASYNIQQLALSYLFNRGITVHMGDLMLNDRSIKEIHNIEETLIAESIQITEKLNQGKLIPPIGKTITEYYEELQSNALNPGDAYWEYILASIDPENNNLYKMIMTGSKGKLWNFAHISSALGQQEINGERMAENFNGRSFPYFTKYDPNPISRGYIGNSYISGTTLVEFLFSTQVARYALINKALSTSITGMHNRMAIKNLESLIVDNQRKSSNNGKVIQLLYGSDGADPRFIEKVKFPTMKKDFSNESFESEFHAKIKMFDEDFQNDNVQKLLDNEYKQLIEDRNFYRELFMNIEVTSGKMYNDTAIMPVNVNRIIEDTLYNLELKKLKSKSNLNPIKTIEKVKKLCDNIVYCLINEIQEKIQSRVPDYLWNCTKLFQILIRSYLNCCLLLKRGINNEALDIIIMHIKNTYSKSLINYGKAIGIIAAQSISEPMTQMVLDSHHNSGAASTKKKGMFRIRETLGARPTDKMKAPSMVLNVLPEFSKNKIKVQEIANHIEMLSLRRFVKSWQIFFEKYGNPIHPSFKNEKDMIKEFEKYNIHITPPSDLANWCIRFNLDKSKLIEKQMTVETIYNKIRKDFPATYIVYNSDNHDNIIMRLYVRNIISKKAIVTSLMIELANDLLDTVIRGVKGIKAAYVQEGPRSIIKEDGSLSSSSQYFIFTDGTNVEEILENPYIDPDTIQSDSIIEMFDCCGITAGRQKIINELKHQVEGSSHRHYTIYADEMTYTGNITSIDRYGSARRESSILLRISDASPISVIEESAINGFTDNLSGISAPILLGKNPNVGDLYNSFNLDEDFVRENTKDLDSILDDL